MKRHDNSGLAGAFDRLRFGPQNILNLRESLPTASQAAQRAEQWLRQKQVEAAGEVLVITGRGKNSEGGVSAVREAVVRLIASLRRRTVIERYEEHTPGSFTIKLAPVTTSDGVPRRSRSDVAVPVVGMPLSPSNLKLLRDLAERSLENVGIKNTHEFLADEMQRQLRSIEAASITGSDREERLRAALRAALDRTP